MAHIFSVGVTVHPFFFCGSFITPFSLVRFVCFNVCLRVRSVSRAVNI